jgi:Tat protein translocase TatB subunit
MFGIGMPELVVILAVALVVIGPKKLPDLAKSLGKALGEFKRATNDLKQSIEQEAGLDEVRDSLKETDRDIRRSFDPTAAPPVDAAPPAGPQAPQGASENADALSQKAETPEAGNETGAAGEADTKGSGTP